MPFEISTDHTFSAAHQLRLYDGTLEPLHGHNWVVRVAVGSANLDGMGVVMDFHELERMVEQIVRPMHNRHLNELAAFSTMNPSTENVALFIGRSLKLPMNVTLLSVDVWETATCRATYRP